MKKWEVSLISDVPAYQVECSEFKTRFGAKRHIRKNLGRRKNFYCAVISHPEEKDISTYYWNGTRIVRWDKPHALSSRQALHLEDDG